MKTCKVCGEQKRRSEIGHNDTCLNCIEKNWDEYYQKKSKEELISMYKSELKESKNSNKMTIFGVLGVIVTYLFVKYIETPDAFAGLGFLEASGNVIGQIITALGFCSLVGIAATICYMLHLAIATHFKSKSSKVVTTIVLIIAIFAVYISFLIA